MVFVFVIQQSRVANNGSSLSSSHGWTCPFLNSYLGLKLTNWRIALSLRLTWNTNQILGTAPNVLTSAGLKLSQDISWWCICLSYHSPQAKDGDNWSSFSCISLWYDRFLIFNDFNHLVIPRIQQRSFESVAGARRPLSASTWREASGRWNGGKLS